MALTKVPSNLDSVTATTQSQGDGSTNVATTAYVDTGLANLIDSAPGNLNTLNELAAAMNDNASFFSTVLPLSGGTMTGDIAHAGSFTLDVGGDITFDAGGGDFVFADDGTTIGAIVNSSTNFVIKSAVSDSDLLLQGNDSGSIITALTIDMSASGQLLAIANTTTNPTFSFENDTDTGLTRPTADTLQLVTGGSERIRIDSSGHTTPGADNAQDLGTNSKRWRNIYSADLQLSNVDTGGNDVDGSEGSWTIQEGENDLFIINRKNGKKYKFNLEEVE